MDPDLLMTELKTAFMRPLRNVFKNTGEEYEFSNLARICRIVEPEKWEKSGWPYAREVVTRSAVGSLSEECPKGCAITWRHIGMTLGGFREDLPLKSGGYGYKELYKILKDESGIPEIDHDYKLRRVIVERFYEYLANALLGLEKQALEGGTQKSADENASPVMGKNEDSETSSDKNRSHSSSDRIYGLFNFVFHGSASIKTKVSEKSPTGRRSAFLVVGTAAVALLIIGFVGVRFLSDHARGGADPLDISLAWSGNPHALLLAFPDAEQETGLAVIEEANSSRDPRGIRDLAVEAGAYHVSELEVHVFLAGIGEDEVQVTNIRPVFQNPPAVAASGLLIRAIGSGGEDITNMQFVLDEPEPVAREWYPDESIDPREGSPYFQSQSISVAPEQDRTVVMRFNAYWGSFDFEVAIDYQVNGEEYTSLLSDGDESYIFRVTGVACPQEPTELGVSENGERNRDVQYAEVWEQAPPDWGIARVEAEGYCEIWQEEGWRPAQ